MSPRPSTVAVIAVCALSACRRENPGGVTSASPTPTAVAVVGPRFTDIASNSGLGFSHFHGGHGDKNFIETMGGGVVLFDFDRDGDLDAYLVQSGPVPGETSERDSRSHLYRNDGGARFTDITDTAGADNGGSYGMGAAAGDYDNDGLPDLYVTNFGANRLYHNEGAGRFREVTASAGIGGDAWSVSVLWADFDGDGLLDLYVANYVDFTMSNNIWCGRKTENLRAYCHPDQYRGVPPRFYRNNGDGTFADRTEAAGLLVTTGKGLGAVASDFDEDGKLDIFGANDSTINYLWRGRGDGTFEDHSLTSGAGYNEDGKVQACMGVDAGDYDGDGHFDIFTTNLDLEYDTLYHNNGNMTFSDASYKAGVAEPHLLYVGFGTVFADFDRDGFTDLFVANGHIIDNIDQMSDTVSYAQGKSLFRNRGTGSFAEVSSGIASLEEKHVSRGAAQGDIDGDGDVDLLVGNNNQPAQLLRNDWLEPGNFLVVETEGRVSNRDGIGARLLLVDGPRSQVAEVRAGNSYASSSDRRVTFGLGRAAKADVLEVRWPSGRVDRFENLAANRWIRVTEGEPVATEQGQR